MIFLITAVFLFGYSAIVFEHLIKVNKAAIALLTGVFCWTVYISFTSDHQLITSQLIEHTGNFSGILFFIMGAMTIVELIDMHHGFDIITRRMNVKTKRQLLWISSLLTFFLSALLDNMTTTIVMISILSRFALEKEERFLFIGLIVIAANAGGAWSPIGDVTTTMLWIEGRISSASIILNLIIPCLVSTIIPLIIASFMIRGAVHLQDNSSLNLNKREIRNRNIVLFSGIGLLFFVPVFKTISHLPPFMGMLLALGALWILIELLHAGDESIDDRPYSAAHALTRIDMPSILFFLGILTSISALEATGLLSSLAKWLDSNIGNLTVINLLIGFLSAIVDNVPLVAGAMGLYGLERFPIDHHFWTFLTYCTGTGGSALIIGSASGVAAMGIAKIDFLWYLRKITPLAVLGFLLGALVYLLQTSILK
jgi:Na+/H+ antiporter NhaD/arsenite permease-like protein